MKEVTYQIDDVVGRLAARIANLETQLAHEQAANNAYKEKIQELYESESAE